MFIKHPTNPIYRFFLVEYKNPQDALSAYEQFLYEQEQANKEKRNRILKKVWKKLCDFFEIKSERKQYEEYLSRSSSLEDLERRQRVWDEYLSHKRNRAFI